jgi:hypothetical protein
MKIFFGGGGGIGTESVNRISHFGDHLLFSDFEPCGMIFMDVFCYNRCHGNLFKLI